MARSVLSLPRHLVRDCKASLAFDGMDDKVVGTVPFVGDSAFTLVAWVNIATTVDAELKCPLSFGSNVGVDVGGGAYLGTVLKGGKYWLGGGISGSSRTATLIEAKPSGWHRLVLRHPGGNAKSAVACDGGAAIESAAAVQINIRAGIGSEVGRFGMNAYCWPGAVSDARIYSRAWTDAEVAADYRGEWVDPTGLVRWWKLEDELPGYAYEEIGKTNDVVTGALPSPLVPFRRRRIVEDVPYAAGVQAAGSSLTIPHHTAFDPDAGDFGVMGWARVNSNPAVVAEILSKKGAAAANPGWRILRYLDRYYFTVADNSGNNAWQWGNNGTGQYINEWHHVALCIDRTAALMLLYMDGGPPICKSIAALTDSISNALDVTAGSVQVGGGWRNDWLTRKGAVFTWEEIRAHYFDGIVPTAPAGSTQIRWGMREGSGTTVASEPAGYNGTLSAASWTTSTRCHARDAATARDAA